MNCLELVATITSTSVLLSYERHLEIDGVERIACNVRTPAGREVASALSIHARCRRLSSPPHALVLSSLTLPFTDRDVAPPRTIVEATLRV